MISPPAPPGKLAWRRASDVQRSNMTTMPNLDDLTQLTGQWTGHSSLWFRPNTPAIECETAATVGTVAGGQLVTVDYTWS
jgi:hypothetical protein